MTGRRQMNDRPEKTEASVTGSFEGGLRSSGMAMTATPVAADMKAARPSGMGAPKA